MSGVVRWEELKEVSTATIKDEEPWIAAIILYQLCFCYRCADKFMAKTVKFGWSQSLTGLSVA